MNLQISFSLLLIFLSNYSLIHICVISVLCERTCFFLQFRARLWCSLEANSIAFTNRIGNISKCRSRVVTYHEDFLHIKPHGALITKSCEIMWQTKTISTIRVHMATKPGRMVTFLDTVSAPPLSAFLLGGQLSVPHFEKGGISKKMSAREDLKSFCYRFLVVRANCFLCQKRNNMASRA